MRPAALDDVRADRDIWHKDAVHHIPMDAIDPRLFEANDLFTETGEVGG